MYNNFSTLTSQISSPKSAYDTAQDYYAGLQKASPSQNKASKFEQRLSEFKTSGKYTSPKKDEASYKIVKKDTGRSSHTEKKESEESTKDLPSEKAITAERELEKTSLDHSKEDTSGNSLSDLSFRAETTLVKEQQDTDETTESKQVSDSQAIKKIDKDSSVVNKQNSKQTDLHLTNDELPDTTLSENKDEKNPSSNHHSKKHESSKEILSDLIQSQEVSSLSAQSQNFESKNDIEQQWTPFNFTHETGENKRSTEDTAAASTKALDEQAQAAKSVEESIHEITASDKENSKSQNNAKNAKLANFYKVQDKADVSSSAGLNDEIQDDMAKEGRDFSILGRSADKNTRSQTFAARMDKLLVPSFNQSVNQNIVSQAKLVLKKNKSGEILLQLQPRELGEVRLKVVLTKKAVSIFAQVENEAARDLIQKNIDNLMQEFNSEGYEMGEFSVLLHENSTESKNKDEHKLDTHRQTNQDDGYSTEKDISSYAIGLNSAIDFKG